MSPVLPLTLRAKQSLFAKLFGQLIGFVYAQGWELTLADGAIDVRRKYRRPDGTIAKGTDAQHMVGSLHYSRLAADVNLFVDGSFITDGGHPAWKSIGEWWERQHELCSWGGRFGDSNHFSVTHGGRR